MTEMGVKHNEIETVAKCRVLAFKRWLFAMQNMAFHASIRGVLEKRWLMAEFGFSFTTLLEAVF